MSFDVAFRTLISHHLLETQRTAGIAKVARVLKPDGWLILVDLNPSRRNLITSLPGHNRAERRDFIRHEVTLRVEAAGFSLIETGPHSSRQLSYAIGRKGG